MFHTVFDMNTARTVFLKCRHNFGRVEHINRIVPFQQVYGFRSHWKLGTSSVEVGATPELQGEAGGEELVANFQSTRYNNLQEQQPAVFHDFKQLGLRNELLEALYENDLNKPTEIQVMSIPRILDGEDVLVASHTGSGKTLSYLLPIVHKLKAEEDKGVVQRVKRPRALILGPTRELTDQILSVTKKLCHRAKFRSLVLNAGKEKSKQRKYLGAPVDIVVATPTRFLQHHRAGNVFIGDIRYLVLDEADTLFDEGFGPEVLRLLDLLQRKNQQEKRPEQISTLQSILVGASVPKRLQEVIDEHFPGLEPLKTNSLHKGVTGAKHVFQALGPGEDKLEMLLQTIEPLRRSNQRMMVFCNTTNCCRAVEHFLRERGIRTVCFHGDVPLRTRKEQMQLFVAAKEDKKSSIKEEERGGGGEEEGEDSPSEGEVEVDEYEGDLSVEQGEDIVPVMVCTDLAARGLDIPGNVQHVINFDFPMNAIDYIHRTGRTARAGQGGTVTSLILRKDRALADKVEWALGHGEPLDQLTGKLLRMATRTKPKREKEVKERQFVAWYKLPYSKRIAFRRKFERQKNWSKFQKDKALVLKDQKLRKKLEHQRRNKPVISPHKFQKLVNVRGY